MSNTTVAVTRLRMSVSGRCAAFTAGFVPSVHMAAKTDYVTLIAARNDAQGGTDAWSPPV